MYYLVLYLAVPWSALIAPMLLSNKQYCIVSYACCVACPSGLILGFACRVIRMFMLAILYVLFRITLISTLCVSRPIGEGIFSAPCREFHGF